jgi:Protein of unknown function (DUF4232)
VRTAPCNLAARFGVRVCVSDLDAFSPLPPRHRRRRDAAAVISAIAVVVLVVGTSLAHHWRSRGIPAVSASQLSSVALSPAATTAAPSVPVSALEPCSAADLHVAPGFAGAATGNISQPFVLTNAGTSDCSLQGYPSLLQGWQGGRWHQLTFTKGTFFIEEDPSPAPVDLPPGAQAELIVGTTDACNGGDVGEGKLYSRLQATLPDGTGIDLDAPVNAFCELDVSSFHPIPVPVSSPPAPTPGPLDALQFQLHAPEQVPAGTALSYTVTVSNPTDANIVFDPCPTWNQLIDIPVGPDGLVQTKGSMDCASTPSIPAHSFITVAMHIDVPTAVGTGKFVWWLTGVASGAGVELVTVVAGSG